MSAAAADGVGDLCPAALMGPAADNGAAALAACQQHFMDELFADMLSFAGGLGTPLHQRF